MNTKISRPWHSPIFSRHSRQPSENVQRLWMQEFCLDLEDLEYVLGSMKLLGSKGTTGTQASFLELFDGDQETIDKIDPMIAEEDGIQRVLSGIRPDLLQKSRYPSD